MKIKNRVSLLNRAVLSKYVTFLIISLSLVVVAHADSAIGTVGEWKYLESNIVSVKRSVLARNHISQGIGNSVEEAITRAEEYCQEAIEKEKSRGLKVLALRGRIINEVSTYMYTSECDLQIIQK